MTDVTPTTPPAPTDQRSGLKKLLDQIAGIGGDEASWPVAVFLVSMFILILSILGIKLALAKRKAAQLAAELKQAQEGEKEAKENADLAANEEARKDAEEIIKDAQSKVTTLQNDLVTQKTNHDECVKELQSITSWDSITVVDKRDPNAV